MLQEPQEGFFRALYRFFCKITPILYAAENEEKRQGINIYIILSYRNHICNMFLIFCEFFTEDFVNFLPDKG